MAKADLKERMRQGVLLLDGGMGTQLFTRGVPAGSCTDYLNIERPRLVEQIQKNYIEAGSDIIITNSFGANRIALKRHGYSHEVVKINLAAAKIARKAAGDGGYVLGDIGPTGDFLKPVGPLSEEEVEEAFGEQAKALVEGGVDGLIIETMTAIDELELAVKEAKAAAGGRPVFASMAFDKAGDTFKTMMGVSVESFLVKAVGLGVDAVGFNCGTISLNDYVRLGQMFVRELAKLGAQVTLFAEMNAGKPQVEDGEAVYSVRPAVFAEAAVKLKSLGFNVLGGCCGTEPVHIKAVAAALK